MSKHTSGVWSYVQHSLEHWQVVSDKPSGVAGTFTEANARLIAAAPDLLDALQDLFNDYKQLADSGDAGFWELENVDAGKKALLAIAKATGEGA